MITYKNFVIDEAILNRYKKAWAKSNIAHYIKTHGTEPSLEIAESFYQIPSYALEKIKRTEYAKYYEKNDNVLDNIIDSQPEIIPPINENDTSFHIIHIDDYPEVFYYTFKNNELTIKGENQKIQILSLSIDNTYISDIGYGETKTYLLNPNTIKVEIHHAIDNIFTGVVSYYYGEYNVFMTKHFLISETFVKDLIDCSGNTTFYPWYNSFAWVGGLRVSLFNYDGDLITVNNRLGTMFVDDEPWELTYHLNETEYYLITCFPNESHSNYYDGFIIDYGNLLNNKTMRQYHPISAENIWERSFSFDRKNTILIDDIFYIKGKDYAGNQLTYEVPIPDNMKSSLT